MKLFLKFFVTIFFFHDVSQAEVEIHDFKKYPQTQIGFKLSEFIKGLNYPWGITFIDKENLIITEKNGGILKVNIVTKEVIKIKHQIKSIPFDGSDQGGLLDVLYNDGYLYFSYSHAHEEINKKKYSSTAIARGKLIKDEIKDFEILLIGKPMLTRNIHWGSRIIIHNNHLYAGFGERGLGMIAQDPSKHPGSIIRINIDGSIPKNNPSNKNKPNWLPEIYQIGVRNPQGMAISPLNQKIYFSQHGPRGGDNIGILKKGGNFGWKDVAWGGKEYYGAKIGTKPFKKKYNLPIISWVPSIGVGQINFYSGNTFPEWNGNLLVSATKAGLLLRLVFENNKINEQEIIINQDIGRIRDFEIGPDGNIFLVIDDENSSLWRLSR